MYLVDIFIAGVPGIHQKMQSSAFPFLVVEADYLRLSGQAFTEYHKNGNFTIAKQKP